MNLSACWRKTRFPNAYRDARWLAAKLRCVKLKRRSNSRAAGFWEARELPSWSQRCCDPTENAICDLAVSAGGGGGQKNVEVVGMNRAKQRIFALDVALADEIDERVF